ncbi:MAG: ASKHA domain-containing protein, partial [Geobacteraceae bacterium]
AFEGGNLACGMAALPGAISMVEVERDRIHIATIGGESATGICGSGVIGAVAGLLDVGVIDATGRLLTAGEVPFNLANSIRQTGGETAFVLYRDAMREVCLSQRDIRQVQLAKAAIRAGMEVLRERADIAYEELWEIVLTGSFGAVLDPGGLEKIGIFTGSMAKIACFVKEGALAGVGKALRIPEGLATVERLAASVKVIPLSGTPVFEKQFLEQMNFPTAK